MPAREGLSRWFRSPPYVVRGMQTSPCAATRYGRHLSQRDKPPRTDAAAAILRGQQGTPIAQVEEAARRPDRGARQATELQHFAGRAPGNFITAARSS